MYQKQSKLQQSNYWLTNISKTAVRISDLGITLQPGKSINLLHPKLHLSINVIEESVNNGSIKSRQSSLLIRRQPPLNKNNNIIQKEVSAYPIIRRNPSAVRIVEKTFDEFEEDKFISENKFAEEFVKDD